jgi:hypothetical protein
MVVSFRYPYWCGGCIETTGSSLSKTVTQEISALDDLTFDLNFDPATAAQVCAAVGSWVWWVRGSSGFVGVSAQL